MAASVITLTLFMLISPALLLAYVMKISSRYALKIETKDGTVQLIFLIILSAVIQIFTIPIYAEFVDYRHGIQVLKFLFDKKTFLVEETTYQLNLKNWLAVTGYILFSYAVSGTVGFIIITLIERGHIKTSIFHGAMYELIVGEDRPRIQCSVMTKFQRDDCYLMYRGLLQEVSYVSKNKVEYISLSEPRSYLIKIDTQMGAIKTSPKKRVSYFPDNEKDIEPELLVIDGENIANVLFTRHIALKSECSQKIVFSILITSGILALTYVYPPFGSWIASSTETILYKIYWARVP